MLYKLTEQKIMPFEHLLEACMGFLLPLEIFRQVKNSKNKLTNTSPVILSDLWASILRRQR
jgi:hypothetical protein